MKNLKSLSPVGVTMIFVLSAPTSIYGRDHKAQHYHASAEALQEVAPEEFPQHGEPNFIFTSRDKRFVFGLGGMVKTTASFDFGEPTENGYGFLTSEIPVDPEPGNGAKWQFNAQPSMVYLTFVGLPGEKNQIGAYINFNFTGENYLPALQYAYVKWRGVTAGYSYTLFTDQQTAAPTIDYQGPNSFTGVQMPLVNYERSFGRGKRWRFGVGLNMPMASITETEGVRAISQRLPDIPAYIQYGTSDGSSHIRLSAILRNIYYRDLRPQARNIDCIGWGVKLSGVYPLTDWLMATAQGVYGEGITSYYQDLTDTGLDMAYTSQYGGMKPVRSWGGYLGLDWGITEQLHLCGTYSHIRLYPGEGCRMPETDATYRYAQYAAATLIYNFTDWLYGGLEYIYGRRVGFDGSQHHNSRLQTAVSFSF